MPTIIEIANDLCHVKKKIKLNLRHAARYVALEQSGGESLDSADLAALIGCSKEDLGYLRQLRDLYVDRFDEGESVVLNGAVTCGACRSTIYRVPCIQCGFDTYITGVKSTTRHKEAPTAFPTDDDYQPPTYSADPFNQGRRP